MRAWREPYLVQRLLPPKKYPPGHFMEGKDNPFIFGGGLRNGGLSQEAMDLLRPIFSFDYMGAGEFEFGAVPKALGSMVGAEDLLTTTFQIKQTDARFDSWDEKRFKPPAKGVKRDVHLIVEMAHYEPAEKFIRSLIKRKSPRLKASSGFRDALLDPVNPEPERAACGWLELYNGFMFFTDFEMFEKMKRVLLHPVEKKV